jgi:RND family efflux transporter MFP subunit
MTPITRFAAATTTLAIAALGAACSGSRREDPPPVATPTVAVMKVARGDLAQKLSISSEFLPFQEIDVHAKVAGYLKSILVDVGDRVAAGQLLGVLEIPEMQNELQQDVAAVARSEEEINRAQADLNRTQSSYEVAHLAATRLEQVLTVRPNLVAQQDIDEAAGKDRVAEAQVATAKAALAVAREQLEMAKANRAKTQTLLAYTRITAPFAGIITKRYADTGVMIQAGTSSQTQAMPIVKLSENSVLRLIIPVPESAVPRIHIGEPVMVSVASLGKTFPGTVSRFASEVNSQTRTMHTEVDVKNPALELIPGMYATAVLSLEQRQSALIVPVQAVDRAGENVSVVIVGPDQHIQLRRISLGLETPDLDEVVSGLSENDLVVVANRSQLKNGMTVVPKLQSFSSDKSDK